MVGSDRALASCLDVSRDAVGAEDGHGARRHVLQRLDKARAFRLERFDDMAIVDDLVAHVDRSAMLGQRPLDNIDRPNDAGAKPARLSKNDLHSPDLLAEASTGEPDDRLVPTRDARDEFRNPSIRGEQGLDKRLSPGRPPHHTMWGARLDLSKPPAAQGFEAIRGPGCNLDANCAKANERKRKENRFFLLSFAFFCFLLLFGIRAFQWVTAEKSRKNFPSSQLASWVVCGALERPFGPMPRFLAPLFKPREFYIIRSILLSSRKNANAAASPLDRPARVTRAPPQPPISS